MRTAIIVLTALLVAAPAFASNSRTGMLETKPQHAPYVNELVVADVLIAIDIDANVGFADLTGLYADAFMNAGATSVATCAVTASFGVINWPADVTADNYPVVCVLTSENWWSTPQNIDPYDEQVMGDYLDTGGNLLFVGQDYMWGAHPDMGACYGFPRDYLGMDFCTQDIIWAPLTAQISGSTGGMFDGESYFLDSTTVFLANEFFPDVCDPVAGGAYQLYYDDAGVDGIGISYDTGTFKTFFSGAEISAQGAADSFHAMIGTIYDWFIGGSTVDNTSWTHIKAMYR